MTLATILIIAFVPADPSYVVDGADMFHLWVVPGPLPFSLSRRAEIHA